MQKHQLLTFIALFLFPFWGFSQCITTYPYSEDFELNGQNGWTSAALVGTFNTWAFGTPAKAVINSAGSGVNSWVTGGLSTGNYSNNEKSAVVSPCFDFSSLVQPQIKLKIWWQSEFSADGTVLQSSIDNGLTWQVVGPAVSNQYNWYNDGSVDAGPGFQTGASAVGWTGLTTNGGSNGWKVAQRVMAGLGGQPNVLLRLAFAANNFATYDGFAFDDVVIQEKFDINLGPDKTICGGVPVVLSPGNFTNATYAWSNFQTTPTITVSNPGTYICTVTDSLGFKDKDTIIVTQSNIFYTLGPDQILCPGQNVTLNTNNPQAAVHQWQDLAGNLLSATSILNVNSSGTYVSTVADLGGCVVKDTINIAIDVVPNMQFGNDTTICFGESILLNAGAGAPGTVYNWNYGPTTQSVYISSPGFYKCIATTANGCQVSDSINIGLVLAPIVNLGQNHVECGIFILDAGNPGATYQWNTGAFTQTVTSSLPGIFSVQVTNTFGCSANDTIQIFAATPFNVALGIDRVICDGVPVNLNAGTFGTGYSYLWSTAATTQNIAVTQPGMYSVAVTSPQGCVRRDTVNVTLSSLNVNLGTDQGLCNGATLVLSAGVSGTSYNWSTGATSPTITVSQPGTYSVAVLDNLGCIVKDTIVITSAGNFQAGINAPATGMLFQNVSFSDNSSPAPTSWAWDFGDSFGTSTNQNPTYAYQSMGTFTVSLTSGNGSCTSTATKDIVINIFIAVEDAELGMDFSIYPNPNDGNFTLDIENTQASSVNMEIADLTGKIVYKHDFGTITSLSAPISVDYLAEGVYILKLQKDDKTIFGKFVVEK